MRTRKFNLNQQFTLFTAINHLSGPLRKQKVTSVGCDWYILMHFVRFCFSRLVGCHHNSRLETKILDCLLSGQVISSHTRPDNFSLAQSPAKLYNTGPLQKRKIRGNTVRGPAVGQNKLLRLPYTFKGRFFSKFFFTAKLNITSLPSFSKKNYFKILKRARVINKNVFSNETLLPAREL